MSADSVRKICVATGNRTDYTRCRTADEIIADGFAPDEYVCQIVEGETPTTMARSIGLGICDLATAFERLRPDVVVVPGAGSGAVT